MELSKRGHRLSYGELTSRALQLMARTLGRRAAVPLLLGGVPLIRLLLRLGIIAATATAVVFGLVTARIALRSTINHPYWWAFVSLLGSPVAVFDWGTGHLTTTELSVQVFNAGFSFGSSGGPALIAVAFPVGALVFRQRRRALVRARYPMRPDNLLPP